MVLGLPGGQFPTLHHVPLLGAARCSPWEMYRSSAACRNLTCLPTLKNAILREARRRRSVRSETWSLVQTSLGLRNISTKEIHFQDFLRKSRAAIRVGIRFQRL